MTDRTLGSSPFAAAIPSVVAAIGYLVAVLVWASAGDALPGGRWLAVHLFTLGVLTNLVLTFSEHFARTLTRAPGERSWWWPLVTNAGIVLLLVGLPVGSRWLVAGGAVVVITAVFLAYLRIRRMRRRALGARFSWIVRVYERAHGAFLHGALLGALLGIAVVPGTWYSGVRAAHLHANVLGWGGLTLLATLVFFGPSMVRARIEAGADVRAASALRVGATGLTLAVLAMLPMGLPGGVGTAARLAAAAGLAALAWAAVVVCVPVARVARHARPSAQRPLVMAVCAWFVTVVWADVALVATGSWRWLDALGVAALAGVLGQAVLATLLYLAPMLRGRSTDARERVRSRVDRAPVVRAGVFNLGVALLVTGTLRVVPVDGLVGAGLVLVAATVVVTLGTVLIPVRAAEPNRERTAA